MMKKLFVIALSVLMLMSLAACGTASAGSASASAQPASVSSQAASSVPVEPATIRFYNYAVSETAKAAWWESTIKNFEAANPSIKIETVAVDYNSMMTTVTNDLASGLSVDIIYGVPAWIPSLVDAGFIGKPADILSKDFYEGYYSNVLDQFKYQGDVYGVPQYYTNSVLFVNKDLVEAAGLSMADFPKTTDDLKSWIDQLGTYYKGNAKVSTIFGLTTAEVPASGQNINCVYTAFGGKLFNDDGTLADLTAEPNKTAMKETLDLHKYLIDSNYTQENLKLKDYRAAFGAGNVCMYMDSSWGYAQIAEVDANAASFTVTEPMPTKMGTNGKGATLVESHAFLFGANLSDAQKKAVDLFVQYCTSTDTMKDYLASIAPAFVAHKNMADCPLSPILEGAAKGVDNIAQQPLVAPIVSIQKQMATTVLNYAVNGMSEEDAVNDFIKQAQYYMNQ